MENETATVTAPIHKIGYKNASKIIEETQKQHISVKGTAKKSFLITEQEFEKLITPEAVCKLGYLFF